MDVNRGWGVGVGVVENGAGGSIQGFRLQQLKHPTRRRAASEFATDWEVGSEKSGAGSRWESVLELWRTGTVGWMG